MTKQFMNLKILKFVLLSEKILCMKKFILVLILVFSINSSARPDDIRKFELEGISIGDSVLNFLSVEEILKKKQYHKEQGNNKRVAHITNIKSSNQYLQINVEFKTNDKNFIIIAITGFVDINRDIKKCYSKKNEIVNAISSQFVDISPRNTGKQKHEFDNSSTYEGDVFQFKTDGKEFIRVQCYDWSKKSGYEDQLRLEIVSSEYYKWLESLL